MSNGYGIPFEETLKCSICQDRIKDTKSLPCGHTYCKGCLASLVDVVKEDDAILPPGSIECPECKEPSLPSGGAEGLPGCFAINSLLGINKTGGGGSATIGRQVRETFSCVFCSKLMIDARYLPCGHSFCRECLTMQPRTTPGIKCSKCLKDHNLPPRGIDGLPVAYRINSIVAEIRSNDNEPKTDESKASSSEKRRHQPRHPHRSPDTNSRPSMEDVGEAKKRAQSQVLVERTNGKSFFVDTSNNTTLGDLQGEIKTRTNIDQSQQRLTFSRWNLDTITPKTRTLSSIGIGNLCTINMTKRLCGGSR